LNSAVDRKISGALSERTIKALGEALSANELPTILVLHHQPVTVGAPWIDRYPLQTSGRFWSEVGQWPQVRGVLWGHIHHEFSATMDRVRLLGAPSTAANSLAGTRKFTLDPNGPGFRWLELRRNGELETGVTFPASPATG
jgi:Icc protein